MIQEHGQHLDGHPAWIHRRSRAYISMGTLSRCAFDTPLGCSYGSRRWRPETVVGRVADRGWLRHDPDRFTLRLRVGDQRRRWLPLTWVA